ncbi:hypothetical protein IV203_023506 [Nitzschia inconspicua]|uniref:Uncharacterized protein n=1 Tax=Nitzschia inconspicua TaxID=303405 RepID=A0A9K3KD50_9STRA|nr:hypothetical protein IV203_023506 [Nitzschia inconspicua]
MKFGLSLNQHHQQSSSKRPDTSKANARIREYVVAEPIEEMYEELEDSEDQSDEYAEEEQSRDDATDAHISYYDGDSQTCTLHSRDDDDGETQVSHQWSTYTDDYSKYTSNIHKMIPDEDDEDCDDRSLFSSYTDAERTLSTIEEREFEKFVRREAILAAMREESEDLKESNGEYDATSAPSSSRFCANFFDLCGFLRSEIADDVEPQSTLTTEARAKSFLNDEIEDNESAFHEDDVESDEDETIEQHEEEDILDVFKDCDQTIASSAPNELSKTMHKIASVPEEKKKTVWRKFRSHVPLLPKRHAKQIAETKTHVIGRDIEKSCKNREPASAEEEASEDPLTEQNFQPKSSKMKQSVKDAVVKNNGSVCKNEKFVASGEQSSETISSRKPLNMLQRFKNAGSISKTSLTATTAGDAAATFDNRRVRSAKTENVTNNGDGTVFTGDSGMDWKALDNPVASYDEIPFTTSTLARGRSITKETLSRVIEQEESKVKTIKKVKIGSDEYGNDTFAYLVVMTDQPPSDFVSENHSHEDTNQLIRGKKEDSNIELSLARPHSVENVTQTNRDTFAEGDRFILMEDDQLPADEASLHNKEENQTQVDLAQTPESGCNNETTTATSKVSAPQSTPARSNEDASESFSENNQKYDNIMEALSFESVATTTPEETNALAKDAITTVVMTKVASNYSATPSHIDELVLVEADDEDEIEIEFEEEEHEEMITSIPSDGAIVIFEARSREGEGAVMKKYQEEIPDTIAPRRGRMKAWKKFWKSRRKTNSTHL